MTAAKAISERELSDSIVACAKVLGYIVYRTWNSQHSEAGFPDLVLMRRLPTPTILVAELKREGKHPTDAQRLWLSYFDAVGIANYVWRPSNWLSGEVEAVLRGDEDMAREYALRIREGRS